MELVPLPGVGPQRLHDALRELMFSCQNARGAGGAGGDADGRFSQYQRWVSSAARSASGVLHQQDVDRLITTPRYWALVSLHLDARRQEVELVDLELDLRKRELEAAVDVLSHRIARLDHHQGVLVVADTNVYLHHERRFDAIDWANVVSASSAGVHLVIPLLVVDELDRQKRTDRQVKARRGHEETVGTRARITLRTLSELFGDPLWVATIRPDPLPTAMPVRAELLLDPPAHHRLPDADAELVRRAVSLRDLSGRPVTIATLDQGMRFRAKAAGLETLTP